MTLAQGSFLCLVFVLPIIGAVVAEWRSIDRAIANLDGLPDDKYMNLHEIGGRRKETLPENVATIGEVHLLSGPGSGPPGGCLADGGSCAAAATSGLRSLLTARVRCANRNSSKREEISRS